jgi:acyl-coenzyme A synthetase/AMP-(fatty) acid ligase
MELFSEINPKNNNVALINELGEVTLYSELFDKREELSKYFKNRSVTLFLTNNSIDSVIIYLSLLQSGSLPVLIDSSILNQFIQGLIKSYNPDYIVSLKNNELHFDDFESSELTSNYNLYTSKITKQAITNIDLGLLLTTSGSTGSPKLVRLTYKNILENTKSICQYLDLCNNDRAITSLPMNYSFGLSVIQTHLYVGASILVTNKSIIEKDFWNLVADLNVTFLAGVPFTYEVLEKIKFRNKELLNLKYLAQAGGKLNVNLVETFAKDSLAKNRKFFVMYGQTEATARMSYMLYENCLNKLGSIGIAIPNGKLTLIDDESNIINESNKIGELVYEGPNVSLGYAESRNDLDLGDQNNGKLFTGDLATKDEDGYFYIVGRKKRFIKLFGNRTNLDEIEQLLKSDAIDCACKGTDDNLLVYITDSLIDINDLKKNISIKLKIHHSVINILYIEDIPKNTSGKINYQLL